MISLHAKLIKNALYSSIVAGLLAWLMFLGVSIYQAMSMHDAWMKDVASLLVGDVTQKKAAQVDVLSDQFHIEYQLYLGQDLLTQSEYQHWIEKIPKTSTAGFELHWMDGQLIRQFDLNHEGLHAVVVQNLTARVDEFWEVSFAFLAILLGLWLIQAFMLHVVIKRQLKPLVNISKAIADKTAQDLTPIQSPSPEVKELKPIIEQLNAMLQRVDAALLAEQRFTADASHELRSPLSAINLRLQVLKRKYQDQAHLPQDLQMIQQDIDRGVHVVENLLLLARLDPEKPEHLSKSIVNVSQLINDVMNMLSPFSMQKAISFDCDVQHIDLYASAELLQICLRNILDNAIRYSPQHGQIKISSQQIQSKVLVVIENQSDHWDDEMLNHLGQRFYRVLGTKTQGTGLGLSICMKILQLHQAKLLFERSELGGLKVIIKFQQSTVLA